MPSMHDHSKTTDRIQSTHLLLDSPLHPPGACSWESRPPAEREICGIDRTRARLRHHYYVDTQLQQQQRRQQQEEAEGRGGGKQAPSSSGAVA